MSNALYAEVAKCWGEVCHLWGQYYVVIVLWGLWMMMML